MGLGVILPRMILVIDNYDSFVHNLARYFECAGAVVRIVRNDAMNCDDIRRMKPDGIVLSPGPCTPDEAGICMEIVRQLGAEIPVLGVCLGHQAIGQAYGLQTVRAPQPMHGKSSLITHAGEGVFNGLPAPMRVGRYHSLIALTNDTQALDASGLEILAQTLEPADVPPLAMALRHRTHPVYGVQFHPESILTENGLELVCNFLNIVKAWKKKKLLLSQEVAA